MTDPVVLMIGEVGDWSIDAVVAELEMRGVGHFCLDTADFPQRMSFTAEFDARWTGTIETAIDTLALSSVSAVYYRKPRDFEFPAGLSGPERTFARAQARVGIGGVLSSLDARWMNHPAALADCEYKPQQLSIAAACGLAVPRTLVTADADRARQFASVVGDLVVKPLAAPIVHEGGGHTAVYTRRVATADLDDLTGIETTAHLLQAWVPKAYEVRLTVVADSLFAVAIVAGSDRSAIDWRTDYDSLSYEIVACPGWIVTAVTEFMRTAGLLYGAFDFVVTPDAQWVFLECNAAGQWGWLVEECDLPIAAAIAEELINGNHP